MLIIERNFILLIFRIYNCEFVECRSKYICSKKDIKKCLNREF